MEPCPLLTVSTLMCWCLDAATCNYDSGLLLMHGKAEALQLAMTGTLLKGKTSLSVAKPIVIHTSEESLPYRSLHSPSCHVLGPMAPAGHFESQFILT